MAEPSLFTDKEAAFLEELTREGVEFLIVGLAAAALQGAPAVTQDIDLWFADLDDPRLKAALSRFGGTYIPPGPNNPPLLVGDGVSLFDVVVHMHGLGEFREEYRKAIRVKIGRCRVRVLPLDRIIVSKKTTNRPKDRAILPVLEDAARTIRARLESPKARKKKPR